MYSRQTRREALLQSARIDALSRRIGHSDREVSSGEKRPGSHRSTDALYLAFEDAYRGDPGEIRERLSVYLPVIKEYGISPDLGPAIDIGCCRGEWLDALKDAGFRAQGCDTNVEMVQACTHRGLNVELMDGLDYLRAVPRDSIAIISAIHVIEHMDFEVLLEFLDASLAVLKPGGIVILESPNPENVLVGTHNFYLDPTHKRPVPMKLAHFLVESRGFCDTRMFGLHAYPSAMHVRDQSEVARRFNDYFYGPQDYAVTGRRV
jgi:SAM-dependent methyltransferase